APSGRGVLGGRGGSLRQSPEARLASRTAAAPHQPAAGNAALESAGAAISFPDVALLLLSPGTELATLNAAPFPHTRCSHWRWEAHT
ncbi:Protein of unknown function, partial [Gryllus bimaculatus]